MTIWMWFEKETLPILWTNLVKNFEHFRWCLGEEVRKHMLDRGQYVVVDDQALFICCDEAEQTYLISTKMLPNFHSYIL